MDPNQHFNEDFVENFINEINALSNFKLSTAFAIINIPILLSILIFTLLCNKHSQSFSKISKMLGYLALFQVLYFCLSSFYYMNALFNCYNKYEKKLKSANLFINSDDSAKDILLRTLKDTRIFFQRHIIQKTPVFLWVLVPILLLCIIFSINFNTSARGRLIDHYNIRIFPTFLTFGSLSCFCVNIVELFQYRHFTFSLFDTYLSHIPTALIGQYILLFGSLLASCFMFKKLAVIAKN